MNRLGPPDSLQKLNQQPPLIESPEEQTFNICTSNPEILVDMFGPDFRTRMIGQMLQVEGEYQRNYCKGAKGSIRITLAHQLRNRFTDAVEKEWPASMNRSC